VVLGLGGSTRDASGLVIVGLGLGGSTWDASGLRSCCLVVLQVLCLKYEMYTFLYLNLVCRCPRQFLKQKNK